MRWISSNAAVECSGQLQRVCARLFLDAEDNCRLGVVGPLAALECLADAYLTQVAYQDGTGVLGRDNDLADLLLVGDTAHSLDQVLLSARDAEARRRVAVGLLQGNLHLTRETW